MEEDPNVIAAAADNTVPADGESLLDLTPASTPGTEGAAVNGNDGDEGQGGDARQEGADDPILNPDAGKEDGRDENEFVGAPETYEDFSLPDGFAIDEEGKTQISELFKGLNLSQKGGQKLVDAFTERMVAQKEAELNELSEKRKQWRAAIRQRPQYASERALAQKGLRAVVSEPEEVALFKNSWMSDHPALFSMFVKVGKMIGEDSPLPNNVPKEDKDTAASRFPVKM